MLAKCCRFFQILLRIQLPFLAIAVRACSLFIRQMVRSYSNSLLQGRKRSVCLLWNPGFISFQCLVMIIMKFTGSLKTTSVKHFFAVILFFSFSAFCQETVTELMLGD